MALQPHLPTSYLADVVRRKPLAGIGKPGIPLRCVLANNGPGLPVFDTQSVDSVELVADEIGAGAQSLAERAEEALTGPVRENETGVCRDDQVVARAKDLVNDNIAITSGWTGILIKLVRNWDSSTFLPSGRGRTAL